MGKWSCMMLVHRNIGKNWKRIQVLLFFPFKFQPNIAQTPTITVFYVSNPQIFYFCQEFDFKKITVAPQQTQSDEYMSSFSLCYLPHISVETQI